MRKKGKKSNDERDVVDRCCGQRRLCGNATGCRRHPSTYRGDDGRHALVGDELVGRHELPPSHLHGGDDAREQGDRREGAKNHI
jgi:hypothetical protein